MNSASLYEAYSAVYNEELRNQSLDLLDEDLDLISDLYDDELEEIVEETIFNLLNEGYEIDDVEEIFEDILSEAKVTMGRGGETGEGKITTGSGSVMAAKGRLAARKERKRKEAIEKVKGAVKKTVSDVKTAAKKTASDIKSRAKEAKFKAVDAPAARYASSRNIGGAAPGLAARSKDPAKRRALRVAVMKDIASRAKSKLQRGVEKVKSAASAAGTSAKKSVKSAAGKAARSVATGAGRVATRLGEETEIVDLFDDIMEYLVAEGYADTNENALVIMANMSEEWRQSIIESFE